MADSVANVILSIGSKFGPGGLASLQAGLQMVGQITSAVLDSVKASQKYAQAYKRLTVDIREADAASKGLVDTYELVVGANKLAAVGLQATSEEMANMTKFAADFAKKTGKDATATFKELTSAITGGRTFALKKYGLTLSESASKAENFAKINEFLAESVKDVDIELETAEEKLFAMANGLDTAAGNATVMFNEMQHGKGVLDLAVEGIDSLNKIMFESMDTMEMMGQEFTELSSMMTGVMIEAAIIINKALESIPFLGGKLIEGRFQENLDLLEKEQNDRLRKMAENERAFREKTGRGSVQFQEGTLGQDVDVRGGKGKRGGGGEDPRIKAERELLGLMGQELAEAQKLFDLEQKMAEFDKDGVATKKFQIDLETASLEEDIGLRNQRLGLIMQEMQMFQTMNEEMFDRDQRALEMEQEKLDLKSQELSMQSQMFDLQAQIKELGELGVETAGFQSDFGLAATEENNELKAQKLDLISQEIELFRTMNEEKLTSLAAEKKAQEDLFNVQEVGAQAVRKGFGLMGKAAGAFFKAAQSGAGLTAESVKNMIADIAGQEAIYYGIQAIVKTGEALYNTISPYGSKQAAAAAWQAAAAYGAGAIALGALSAALGGGGKSSGGGGGTANAPAGGGAAGDAPVSSVGGGAEAASQTVNVTLQGDAADIWTVVNTENENRRSHDLNTLEDNE
jgi:hypothetical protein